ncbi:MAG: hypothetical protein D3923_07460 [Candidatus Electrothrix sp. AR3]|nr:hypothetical protein [Candidatus Electrothrix sp. AR3]
MECNAFLRFGQREREKREKTDLGSGEFELFFFLRTKDKRKVDFLVTGDSSTPWFLVEVKSSDTSIRHIFRRSPGAHAFQMTVDPPSVDADCFAVSYPVKVPAKTFIYSLFE